MSKGSRYVSAAQFKRARKRLGYTQAKSAELCGVHLTTLQRWEMGRSKRGVRRVYLERLSAAL